VPFDFYKTVDVQTGGYPAEFGRATGGVVNATTKSGSNIPFIGLHLNWEPASLQSHRPNRGLSTSPTDIGRLAEDESKSATLEAGGAIVPDHLFVYGLIQGNRNTTKRAYSNSGVYEVTSDRDPFWGVKVDGYITPTQHAEFTIFDTRSRIKYSDYGFTPNSTFTGGTIDYSTQPTIAFQEAGGINWVARYTGGVTDWLTLSGAYGVSKNAGSFLPNDPAGFYVVDRRSTHNGVLDNPTQSTKLISAQTFLTQDVLNTKRRFYRGDADVRFTALGQHRVRFGFDNEDLSETKITQLNGIAPVDISYRNTGIQMIYERLGGAISARDTAYYVQDSWTDLIQGLTLNFGIRNDIFKQTNLSGEQYLSLEGNWGPRFGFSYTPPSNDKWRFFGNYGRYFIPPARC